jgi:NADH-quinone oxidoreductase subunit K
LDTRTSAGAVGAAEPTDSRQWDNLNGQVFVFMIMAVAAAEVAVGLAILIAQSHLSNSINVDDVDLMKW